MSLALRHSWWSMGMAAFAALATVQVVAPGPAAAREVATPVVPAPRRVVPHEGRFLPGPDTAIEVEGGEPALLRTARILATQLARARGWALPVRPLRPGERPRTGAIVLARTAAAQGTRDEAYALEITPRGVRIDAATPHGVFNGAMTLLQLLVAAPTEGVAAQRIEDAPRFAWRGLMLDSARHLQSVDEIKRFLDAMALHKLDVFQWHLTDDQGWRIPITKYPKLTEVGAWRIPAGAAGRDAAGKPVRYGGFYTHAQIREVVAYAAERYITVVPEIDLPGHAQAAIAAYPAFGVTGDAPPVSPDWGVHTWLFNAEEGTWRFLEDVLAEVITLFPGPFVHIGGDEAVKDQWKASQRVQARMRALGVRDETALQAHLTARMQRYLAAHGRRLIGWDEILEGGLPADAAVMSWRGIDGGLAATAQGHDAVLSPWPLLYLDNRQGTGADEPPGRVRVVSLQDVYAFDPMPPAMTAAQKTHLLGVQANVWTEHIRTAGRVQWMAFPRAAALAEVAWSAPARRDWNDFRARLPALLETYQALGVAHADSSVAVAVARQPLATGERLTLSTQAGVGAIRYTLDGRDPTALSPVYSAPIEVAAAAVLSAATFDGARRLSQVHRVEVGPRAERRIRSADMRLCSEGIALALEDDAPASGARAIFHVDIQNPCWILPQLDLSVPTTLVAEVGSVPFNFQIGADAAKIRFDAPSTAEGELLLRLDGCEGEPVLRVPLGVAAGEDAVATLPAAVLPVRAGHHDLCLRFSQPRLDPIRTLDAVRLSTAEAR